MNSQHLSSKQGICFSTGAWFHLQRLCKHSLNQKKEKQKKRKGNVVEQWEKDLRGTL